jgi:hypothetical protein
MRPHGSTRPLSAMNGAEALNSKASPTVHPRRARIDGGVPRTCAPAPHCGALSASNGSRLACPVDTPVGGKRRSCLPAREAPNSLQRAPGLARFTSQNGGRVLVLIRSAGAPSRVQNGADLPAGYPSLAWSTGLEPASGFLRTEGLLQLSYDQKFRARPAATENRRRPPIYFSKLGLPTEEVAPSLVQVIWRE